MRWEKFFRCEDLGKDLPPVIKAPKKALSFWSWGGLQGLGGQGGCPKGVQRGGSTGAVCIEIQRDRMRCTKRRRLRFQSHSPSRSLSASRNSKSSQDFLTANAEKLAAGESVSLLGLDHPDKATLVRHLLDSEP